MPEIPIDPRRAALQGTAILARVVVGGVFALAATMKLGDLGAFAKEVRGYQVAPDAWSHAIANVVPWLELIAVACLITGVLRREGRALLLAMLVGFTGLKFWVIYKGLKITCGCFGNTVLTKVFSGNLGIALNLVLITLLLVEYFAARALRRRVRATSTASVARSDVHAPATAAPAAPPGA
ncbi:MAG: DoxX family protein [Phycisphaerae bacterium]